MLIIDKLGYEDNQVHGGGRVVLDWVRGLLQIGVDAHCLVLRSRGRGHGTPEAELEQSEVNYLGRGRFEPAVFTDLVQLIRARGIQIVHLHSFASGIFGRLASRWCGIPAVVHSHEDLRVERVHYRRWMGVLDAGVAPLTTLCLAASTAAARSAVEVQHIAADRVRVLENPVDLGRFTQPDRQTVDRRKLELGVPSGAPTVVCIARLFPVKGVDLLVTAWKEVVRAVPAAHLLIAGNGPMRGAIEESTRAAGLGTSVHFLGFHPHVEQVLQAGDLAVIPSRAEGFSLTALEAMATGLPVVAFGVGGLAEVVRDGRSGVLVAAGNTDGLAAAMVALLRDPERRRAFSEAGAALASAYGLPASVAQLKKEYEWAIQTAARR